MAPDVREGESDMTGGVVYRRTGEGLGVVHFFHHSRLLACRNENPTWPAALSTAMDTQ